MRFDIRGAVLPTSPRASTPVVLERAAAQAPDGGVLITSGTGESRQAAEIASWAMKRPKRVTSHEAGARLDHVAFSVEQATGNVFGQDQSPLPDLGDLSAFGDWFSVATTLLRTAQQRGDYDPASTRSVGLAQNDYLVDLKVAPFYLRMSESARMVEISQTHLKGILDAAGELLDGITTPETFDAVVASIRRIASATRDNEGAAQKLSQTLQGVLSIHRGELHIAYLRANVFLSRDPESGYALIAQNMSLRRFHGVLDLDKCKRFSAWLLARRAPHGVTDWAQHTTSAGRQPNDSPAWTR
ncbi:hypothetical protein [Chondromyces crocatus]|nr:hypothetical protein [Chondromyces crocatus]